MGLKWVEMECPDCGKIGHRADADGGETKADRYVKCPDCRDPVKRDDGGSS